jgi:phosphoribosylanthranilate isomerase
MKSLRLKICGMRDPENIRKVASMGPDYMGFIFYEGSSRYVGKDFILPESITFGVTRVGVFVNSPVEEMIRTAQSYGLTHLQLHGDEPVESCQVLTDRGLKVIKAFSVDDSFDFKNTQPYGRAVDFFLFDTKGKNYGGNARAFDWTILDRYDQEKPFFLSGGLSFENVHETRRLMNMNIHALDVNSGVESAPGVKDVEKVKKIYDYVRSQKIKEQTS